MRPTSARLLLLAALAVAGAFMWLQPSMPASGPAESPSGGSGSASTSTDWPSFLPPEARPVLQRIATGAPHPYRQDGSVFHNRESRLPAKPSGWYREYTVDTPGLRHRGARRIVTGGRPPADYYYTDDHYASFRPFQPPVELRP